MKKITTIFERSDVNNFREKCGSFLEGSDGVLHQWGLGEFSRELESDAKQINFSLCLVEKGDKELLEKLKIYLMKEISSSEAEIERKQKEIDDAKAKIKIRKESLELSQKSKTFYSFFRSVSISSLK